MIWDEFLSPDGTACLSSPDAQATGRDGKRVVTAGKSSKKNLRIIEGCVLYFCIQIPVLEIVVHAFQEEASQRSVYHSVVVGV